MWLWILLRVDYWIQFWFAFIHFFQRNNCYNYIQQLKKIIELFSLSLLKCILKWNICINHNKCSENKFNFFYFTISNKISFFRIKILVCSCSSRIIHTNTEKAKNYKYFNSWTVIQNHFTMQTMFNEFYCEKSWSRFYDTTFHFSHKID